MLLARVDFSARAPVDGNYSNFRRSEEDGHTLYRRFGFCHPPPGRTSVSRRSEFTHSVCRVVTFGGLGDTVSGDGHRVLKVVGKCSRRRITAVNWRLRREWQRRHDAIQRYGTHFPCIDGVSSHLSRLGSFPLGFPFSQFSFNHSNFLYLSGVEWHYSYEEKVSRQLHCLVCIRLEERRFICFSCFSLQFYYYEDKWGKCSDVIDLFFSLFPNHSNGFKLH